MQKIEKIYHAYLSKHQKQVILLMIPKTEGFHYIAVKNLLALLRGITKT